LPSLKTLSDKSFMLHSATNTAGFGLFKVREGKIVSEAATHMLPPMDLSNESSQAVISPHMSECTILTLLALFCTVISLAGLASVVPWDNIWTSWNAHMATRRANTGMKDKSIKALPSIIYGKSIMPLLATECAICLAEFVEGEDVKVLPRCNHGFHMECVDKWLRSHSSCPTCRHCLLDPGCKNVANHIQPSKSDAREAQIHQARVSRESGEILIDLECGMNP